MSYGAANVSQAHLPWHGCIFAVCCAFTVRPIFHSMAAHSLVHTIGMSQPWECNYLVVNVVLMWLGGGVGVPLEFMYGVRMNISKLTISWPELARHPIIPERSPPSQGWPKDFPVFQPTSWLSWLVNNLAWTGDLGTLLNLDTGLN
ncbi:hypothetical protein EDC04DRAFT_2603835 [Pisolithus marmoratus]|nr:hypothetical protein EDC04DRAFT_2603835 [Pisolithus marmoratus]